MADVFDRISGDVFDKVKPDVFDKVAESPSFLSRIGTGMSQMAKSEAEGVRAVVETSGTLASGATSWIPAGLYMASELAAGSMPNEKKDIGKSAKRAKGIQETLTYEPKTEQGKELSELALTPITAVSNKFKEGAEYSKQKGMEAEAKGDTTLAKQWYAAEAAARFGEEAWMFALPAFVKGLKVVGGKIKNTGNLNALKDVVKEAKGDYAVKPDVFDRVAPQEKVASVKEQIADVPREQTVSAPVERPMPAKEPVSTIAEKPPLVEGELQPHRTALRVEAESISKELLGREGLGKDIAKYEVEKGMMDAQAKIGIDIMDADWSNAVKMALGDIPAPEGVRPGTMITAVTKRAIEKGDFETVYKLGTTEKSYTLAQEVAKDLKSFDQGLSDSPVAAIRSVAKARQEELVKTGVKVDPVKQEVEIQRLSKELESTQKMLEEHLAKTAISKAERKARTPIKYGTENKLVTQSEYLKVKEELRQQFGSQLNAGLDPVIAAKLGKIGAYHLEAGARSLKVWSDRVIGDVGVWVKPYLEQIWKQAHDEIGKPINTQEKNLQRLKKRWENDTNKFNRQLETLEPTREKQPSIIDREGRRLKDARDRAKIARDAAIRKTGTVTREEAARLFELSQKAAELKSKHDPTVINNHGFPSAKDRFEYGKAQVEFERYVAKLKEGDQSLSTLAKRRIGEFKTTAKDNPVKAVKDVAVDILGEISDSSIALVASLDNSFIGRQGLTTLQTHPTVWARAATKSFSDVYKALRDKHGNEIAKDILHADLVSRENYLNGNYQKSGILAKFEEQYPTSHPARVPIVGRAFKASEVAFTNSALRMRIGTFDLLFDMAKKSGLEITDVAIKDIGAIVNAATARSPIGHSKVVNALLWAPKMMMANVNVLTAHGLGGGLKTNFARKQAAYNLMKIVGETAAVVAVLNALRPEAVELDPRSSDFLKYRDGNTRIDLTAGRGQYITLVARIFPFLGGKTKNAQTKIVTDLGLAGFGDRTYFDVGLDFLINKTTPLVRQGVYLAKQRNFEGKKPTLASTIVDLTTPIPVKNIVDDSFGDYSDDRAIVLISNLMDVFGINANTYQNLAQWDSSNSKELQEFRQRIGEERFKQANIKYNKMVNQRIDQIVQTERYKKLSNEEKKKVIERLKRDAKKAF